MSVNSFNQKLFSFLANSTSPYHAVHEMAKIFKKAGFKQLDEQKDLSGYTGGPCCITREDGSITAFNFGSKKKKGFRLLGTHSDSPCLQIKPKPDLFDNNFHRLAVEVYGGALLNPWFDRELSIAGRVNYLSKSNKINSKLVDFRSPVGIIPSLAIHLDREANKSKSVNPQKDITPLVGIHSSKKTSLALEIKNYIAKKYPKISYEKLLSYDLFFYDYHTPGLAGFNDEFIISSRLDNLLSCFTAASAIAEADKKQNFIFICNNHEEVGSNTASGAQGNFLISLLERLFPHNDERYTTFANSFFISIDNAHAVHPNFPEKHDPSHDITLNKGPVLKINSNQRYATTSLSQSIFKFLCEEINIPVQDFVMRNDLACGSTIGPMTAAKLGIKTVDIGAATLAMHSIREMTGSRDPHYIYKTLEHFLNRDKLPEIDT